MKYNAPFGSADPNASYADRNTPGAVTGSRLPALAVEMPQREIVSVIIDAGLTPDNGDPTQLLQAINLKIAEVTGGEGDDNYVLMTQARGRIPAFPETLTADGKIPALSPGAGQFRVPAGYSFLHRGIFSVTTVQTDFVTVANKVYHARWNPTDGIVFKDLADPAYNPGAVAETSSNFDSKYDDMLLARVTTDAGNIVTVKNLANKDRLFADFTKATIENQGGGSWVGLPVLTGNIDWARTPKIVSASNYNVEFTSVEEAMVSLVTTRTRYTVTGQSRGYVIGQSVGYAAYVSGTISLDVAA